MKFIWENKLNEKYLSTAKSMVVGHNYLTGFKITCDDIFALFLIYMSRIICLKFYRTVVIFIKLMRDCMNKIGWEILSQYKDLSNENTSMEYTTVKNGELLPEIVNDFVNFFLSFDLPKFDKHLAVVTLNHFSDWMLKFNFSPIRLKFDNESNDAVLK